MNMGEYLRRLVIGADTKVPLNSGEYVTAINFDNAATTPPFCTVMHEVAEYAPWYASVHRGAGYKSTVTSDLYEEGREVVKKFVNAGPQDVVIFTKNTTESINVLAYALAEAGSGQVVLSTTMEHLANDLPWREKFTVDYVGLNQFGQLSINDLKAKLVKYQGKVKLVTVTGASNVTGYINPIHKIARLAHEHGAQILVDAAQLVPHALVDMMPAGTPGHIDFLAFSAHKLYAPFGAGVLIGPRDTLAKATPVYQGGGAVGLVSHQFIEWDVPPGRYEAGTPNMMGVLALKTAIKTLNQVGINVVHDYEKTLINYALAGLADIPGLTLYSCRNGSEPRVSLISFNIVGMYHGQVAQILSQEAGIAARNGLFCAHPYVEKLLNLSDEQLSYYHTHDVTVPGLVRISFALYNTCHEIDCLIELLSKIVNNKKKYQDKYKEAVPVKRCGHPNCDDFPYC